MSCMYSGTMELTCIELQLHLPVACVDSCSLPITTLYSHEAPLLFRYGRYPATQLIDSLDRCTINNLHALLICISCASSILTELQG